MYKYCCAFLISVFFYLHGICQVKLDTLRLFYNINETQSDLNFKRIDSLASKLNDKKLKFKIYGYADFLHSNQYNLLLSQKRADIVKNHLLNKLAASEIFNIICKGLGEKSSVDNLSPKGDSFQRRVDIITEYSITTQLADDNSETIIPENQPSKSKKNIEDLVKGESLAVEGLNFEPGRHYLVEQAVPVLNKLLKTLQIKKTLKIEIQGHICCEMNESDGMDLDTREKKLSENRAKAIYDFLTIKGIDSTRLTYKGYGHSRPKISPETNSREEQINRRVEILVLEK